MAAEGQARPQPRPGAPTWIVVALALFGAVLVLLPVGQSLVPGGRDLAIGIRLGEGLVGLALIGTSTALRLGTVWARGVALALCLGLAALMVATAVWALVWPKADGHGMAYVAMGALVWAALPLSCAAGLRSHRAVERSGS